MAGTFFTESGKREKGMASTKILLFEPGEAFGAEIKEFLSHEGHAVNWVRDDKECRRWLDRDNFDVLILESKLPGKVVFELVDHAKGVNSYGMVICLTDPEDMALTIKAMERGADAYLKRPLEKQELRITLQRLLDYRSLLGANFYLRRTQDLIYRFDDIIGKSPPLQNVLGVVKKIARSNASVLILGETGTGKELIAGAIHYNSSRKGRNFIKVNCSALQDTLLESELFGHEKGAFTGADKQRIGRFEQANLGTIFLDEISDMSPNSQAKILRVLQEQEFERVGGTKSIKVDVRVISATNKNLKKEIAANRFRDDLYYRLNVITLDLPPLRERREDILPLAYYFLRRFSGELGKTVLGFTPEAERRLEEYQWPGNIRELRNTLESAVLLGERELIHPEDLSLFWSDSPAQMERLVDKEKKLVLEALKKAKWVQKDAARYLGISTRVMNYKIHKFGIRNPGWIKNR